MGQLLYFRVVLSAPIAKCVCVGGGGDITKLHRLCYSKTHFRIAVYFPHRLQRKKQKKKEEENTAGFRTHDLFYP